MNTQNHLSKNDIIQVLSDFDSAELEQRVEVHVSDCDQCRSKLESFAAQPDLWQQASTILTEDRVGETIAFSSRFIHREPHRDDEILSENVAGYSVEAMLEKPGHPEMLGRLGHYEIEREIGRGGMGVVLKAHDTELNRPVAIKMMAPHLASFGIARQRFAREARSAAAVLHPNVIAIHAVSKDSQTPWLVMPYIVGPSLEQIVQQEGSLDERDLVSFAMQIAAGLAAAHSQGVVHRDIKPANVLVESGMGRAVITDFGLARAECDASMTQTGWFAGTPNFMSPEQSRGKEIDHRSDLFSLGGVMFFMATGRLPFRADGPMAVLEKIRGHQPAPVRSINSRISKTLSNLIERLLAKDPENRIQTAAEIHEVLEQYLAHLHHPTARMKPIVKTPSAIRSRSKGQGKGRNTLWLAATTVAVCGLVSAATWFAVSRIWGGGVDDRGDKNLANTTSSAPLTAKTYHQIANEHGLTSTDELENQLQVMGQQIDQLDSSLNGLSVGAMNPDPLLQDLINLERQMQQIDLGPIENSQKQN